MRWPLRKKPSGASEPRRETPGDRRQTPAPPVVVEQPRSGAPEPAAPQVAPSRPRPDWAHVGVLTPVVSAPPITFDGERFGRSVAGGRALTPSHRVYTGRNAPGGVMHDVAKVEAVVPQPADSAVALLDAPGGPVPVLPSTPGIVHRKASPGRAGVQRLMTSDFEGAFPATELHQPTPAPTMWTPDTGFVEPVEDDEAPTRMRVVRRRAAAPAPRGDDGDDEIEEIAESDEHDIEPDRRAPVVRFVPLEGPRRVSPPPDLVDVIEQVTGIHVGDTVIDRSLTASERAHEMGAVAFTEHGVVNLPSELGPMDDPAVRSVTAHELVHVAQHRLREGDIPSEDSPEGQELEAQARHVQRRVAPGAPVVPTFLREQSSRPVRREVGPAGVQRLANQATEYEGQDFSEINFSPIEPGSSEDIFAWQERHGEPYDVPWHERQAWAEQFEDANADRLQRSRDDYFRGVAQQLGPGLTENDLPRLRQQLDQRMPYQFGVPFGIDPYPDVDLPGSSGEGPQTGGGVGAGVGAGLGAGTRTLSAIQRTELTPLQLAESDASRRELAVLSRASRRRTAASPPGEVSNYEEALARLQGRLDLEREMRIELLDIKREAAEQEGAPATHIVSLTQDEIDEIRDLVDGELPADGVDYLSQDDHASITMSRAYGGFVEAAAASSMRHARGARGSGTAGSTSSTSTSSTGSRTTTTAGGGGNAPGGEEEDPDSAAARMLDSLRRLRPNVVSEEDAFGVTAVELMDMMRERFARETQLRKDLLRAKKADLGERAAQLPQDFMICLSRQEITAIRGAVDNIWPLIVGNGLYLGDDDFSSLGLVDDEDWGPFYDEPETVEDAIARRRREEGRAEGDTAPATQTAGESGQVSITPTATGGVPATNGDQGTPGVAALVQATTPPAPPMGTTATAATTDGEPATIAQVGSTAGDEAENAVEALSDIDLDRLTRRLWLRIRRELRTELLIDRERAGVLADMR